MDTVKPAVPTPLIPLHRIGEHPDQSRRDRRRDEDRPAPQDSHETPPSPLAPPEPEGPGHTSPGHIVDRRV